MSINYEKLYEKAFEYALQMHANQFDKAQIPYIYHLITVSNKGKGIKEKIVGILHDILEDTKATISDLKKIGLNEELIESIIAITKIEKEDYFEYLLRVKNDPISRSVKLSDLEHNMDLSRLKTITDSDLKRLEKYKYATNFLRK